MQQDLSNKTLAVLLGISILISLGGLIVFLTQGREQITGAATAPEALARINITSRSSINWTVTTVNWGTGYVVEGKDFCILDTEGTNDADNCTDFTTVTQGLRLENNGNRLVSLNLTSNVTPFQFLSGTNPEFQWKLANNESNSCGGTDGATALNCNVSAEALEDTTWTTVDTTGNSEICPCFNFNDTNDKLNAELRILLPSDSLTGVREAVLTMTATTI